MKRILLLAICCIAGFSVSAQLQDGAMAPDFTAIDIEGNEHNLYDILAEGKTVVLDVSATWCPPCWSYHTSGALEGFMNDYGPQGTDEAMVFHIEGDISTTLADLNGTGTNTQGDWVSTAHYPIIDNAGLNTMYEVNYFPTVYMVCPDRLIREVGQLSTANLAAAMGTCPTQDLAPDPAFKSNATTGCGNMEVKFQDTSWPRPTEWLWDFGDGSTSTDRNYSHVYNTPGEYDITLKVKNAFGETEEIDQAAIFVGEGFNLPRVKTGMPTNTEPGSDGAYFAGGHQGMIFDALSDFVLTSATAYSEKADWRTFVVFDNTNNLIARQDVFIEVGEHRVQLDIEIPQGTDYRITMWSDAHLWRTNTGGGYPHLVDGVVNIKGSTVTTAGVDPNLFYYYLYDWEVRPVGCTENTSSVKDIEEVQLVVYPNPAWDLLTVESVDLDLSQLSVMDISGKILALNANVGEHYATIDVSALQSGFYLIRVADKLEKFYKH